MNTFAFSQTSKLNKVSKKNRAQRLHDDVQLWINPNCQQL